MKVYSNLLTEDDLYASLPSGVIIDVIDIMSNPRKCSHGWHIFLSGSSHALGQGREAKAATYMEHGAWMAALYAIDPFAMVACYKNAEDFVRVTQGKFPV